MGLGKYTLDDDDDERAAIMRFPFPRMSSADSCDWAWWSRRAMKKVRDPALTRFTEAFWNMMGILILDEGRCFVTTDKAVIRYFNIMEMAAKHAIPSREAVEGMGVMILYRDNYKIMRSEDACDRESILDFLSHKTDTDCSICNKAMDPGEVFWCATCNSQTHRACMGMDRVLDWISCPMCNTNVMKRVE